MDKPAYVKLRTGEYGYELDSEDVTDLWSCVAIQLARLATLIEREIDRGERRRLEKRREKLALLGEKLTNSHAGELHTAPV
jgi:hypothetical protein